MKSIDIHVHIQPWEMFTPAVLETFRKGKKDFDDLRRYCDDPVAFLGYLDSQQVERVGLINYVSDLMGFTSETNDFISRVAVDFPNLKLLLAHGGRPIWMETAFFLMRRHKNLYLDISGIPPQRLLEYFPRFVEIADRALFGSDWPSPGVPEIGENVKRFQSLGLPPEIQRRVLYGNAAALFDQ